jgi:hypothetical protein
MITDIELATAALPPAPEPKKRDKKWRHPHPRPGAQKKRGPARPYKRIEAEVLDVRIGKMTTRIERLKRQHENVRKLLTKYSHEKTYRLREALTEQPSEGLPPLPEFEPIPDDTPEVV